MQYCMNGSSLSNGWIHGGINSCVIDPVSSAVLFFYILIVSIIIHCTGKRKKKPSVDEEDPCATPPIERPWDNILRIMLGIMLLVEAVLHAVAQDTLTGQNSIVGYQLLTAIFLFCAWVMFVRLETTDIPATPIPTEKPNKQRSRRLLLVFICLAIIKELLAFVSWSSSWFWWSLKSTSNEIEFGLWLVRTVCGLLLLTLSELPQHLCPARDHSPISTDDKKKWKKMAREKSTWINVLVKLRMMVPYVFPKDSFSKQVLLCVCVVILGIGRGVNLLVPIVSKTIVNDLSSKLTEESPSHSVNYVLTNTSTDGNKTTSLLFENIQAGTNLEHAANKSNISMVTKEETDVGFFESGPIFCWREIIIYCFLMFLKGGGAGNSGLLNNLRSFCWVPVQQYTTKRIQVNLFHHLQCLSLRWHLQRRTGEVLRIVDRGTNSINVLLSCGYVAGVACEAGVAYSSGAPELTSSLFGGPRVYRDFVVYFSMSIAASAGHLLFQILPIIADIVIAIVYFMSTFNYLFGLVVFLCMAFYVGLSVVLTEWRTKYRRDLNKLDNEKNAKAVDALLNFETVKYYGASEYEKDQYDAAIVKHQKAELVSSLTFHILNTTQNIVISFGTISGSLMCAWAVVYSVKGLHLTVGDYVLFGTYLNQLYGPLQWLGNYYRMIQQSFVDMENMFDLFQEKQEIKDVEDAKDIIVTDGRIEFKDVCFHYDPSKKILQNISFCVAPGQTYALVGHSGSGKSTVIRLLFRFYDITSGVIEIDGQDISKVKQESLRQCIGVVPQDTVLFNKDIKYNIRYGRVCATDEEIIEAADAADIHDRILNFPNQYDTLVGERGLKLSGGEKQRVAIARTLLKSPVVVLLDEATSALDTKTERNIQKSLARVCDNRTTIVVAHRLSTIVNADQILVMREGEIVERGCHEELLKQNGHYADMWQQQLQWEKDHKQDADVIN